MSELVNIEPLSDAARQGAISVIILGFVSLVTTASLLIYLAYNNLSQFSFRKPPSDTAPTHWYSYFLSFHWPPRSIRKIYKNEGYFWLVNLFFTSFFQSIGKILCLYHLEKGFVAPGAVCNVQGVFINSGDLGSALWSFVIAMHTLRWSARRVRLSEGGNQAELSGKSSTFWQWGLCIGIWMFVIFVGIIGFQIEKWQPENGPFYTSVSASWCWIGRNYILERWLFLYVFIFLNIAALIFMYTTAYFNLNKAARFQNENVQKEQRQIAISLMFYPTVYMFLTLTLAIARTLNKDLNPMWYFVGESLYACEGWCNVLLYTTREGVIPWTWTGWRNDLLALMEAYHPDPPKRD